jgi:hypothetical protein
MYNVVHFYMIDKLTVISKDSNQDMQKMPGVYSVLAPKAGVEIALMWLESRVKGA